MTPVTTADAVERARDLAPARNAMRRLLLPRVPFWLVESVVAHIP